MNKKRCQQTGRSKWVSSKKDWYGQ